MRTFRHLRYATAAAAILGIFAGLAPAMACAQNYPSMPVRILVPLSVGSQTDILARIVAQKMSEAWRQPVIVENRPGGAGAIAGGMVVKADPDGHTLMMHSDGHAVSAVLYAAK